MGYLLSALYVLGLYSAYLAGSLYLRTKSATFRLPWATLVLLLVVGVPTTLQFFFPVLLPLLQRDTSQILQGEWWRIVTALFAQDGGVAGAVFNVVSLLLVGAVAEQFWDSRQIFALFFVGGILAQVIAFAWQPIGAGNSVANFNLAAGIAVSCILRRPPRPIQFLALLPFVIYLVLIALRDIHGPAGMIGAVLALIFSRMGQRKDQ